LNATETVETQYFECDKACRDAKIWRRKILETQDFTSLQVLYANIRLFLTWKVLKSI